VAFKERDSQFFFRPFLLLLKKVLCGGAQLPRFEFSTQHRCSHFSELILELNQHCSFNARRHVRQQRNVSGNFVNI
jgi:hypothetical protein